jgi:uncharacterized protein HemY
MKWFGKLEFLGQHVNVYVQMLILVFSGGAFYVSIHDKLLEHYGIEISVWMFALAVIVFLTVAALFKWSISLPGFFSAWNKQWWEHDNPMRKELDEIKKQLLRIENDR